MGAEREQRVALVTGASRGIGRAIAERLAADGRKVVLAARSVDKLEDVASVIESAGGAAATLSLDITDLDGLQSAVEGVVSEHGRLDILVNNAGITRDGLAMRMSDDDFESVIRTNLTASFVACRAASRPMMRQRFGRLVHIGSTSGVVGNQGQANYCAAKAGLLGLSKSLARELGSKGVTSNVVAPGFVQTDMTAGLPKEVTDRVLSGMSVKRLGVPDDIAAAVSYVSSDGAGFLTGQTLCVDGGLTMC